MENMFYDEAVEMFKTADINLNTELAIKLFNDVQNILATKMALLSANSGLSEKRLGHYEKQKQALLNDLKKFKKEGKFEV